MFAEPSHKTKVAIEQIQDPKNWKMPTGIFGTFNKNRAEAVYEGLIFYMGGAEIREKETDQGVLYMVQSKGYYHYVGA